MSTKAPGSGFNGHYPQSKLSTIRVYKHRARYDYETVHNIIDSTLVSHVSFISTDEDGEPLPLNFPLTAVLGKYDEARSASDYDRFRDGELEAEQQDSVRHGPMDLYLHSNAASQLYKAIKANPTGSVRVCITSTKVDGIVLFLTPNGHSLNYRSATVHGAASLLPASPSAKRLWAMRLLTNHMVSQRWQHAHPVAASAMQHVQIIEVKIRAASAKVRAKNIGDFDPEAVVRETGAENWTRKGVWTGVLPLYEMLGEGVSSGVSELGEKDGAKKSVETWRAERNRREREYAANAAARGEEEEQSRVRLQACESKLDLPTLAMNGSGNGHD